MDNTSSIVTGTSAKVDHRRSTRSSSTASENKIKDSENCISGDNLVEGNKKRLAQNKTVRGENGEVVSFTADSGVTYTVGESAYFANERADNPYLICTIQEIKVNKRENAVATLKWYYRATDVPDSVYQLLLRDRICGKDESKTKMINNRDFANRELFISDIDTTETYPISQLRGKCFVSHLNSIEDFIKFDLKDDHFFCVLSYNSETRRLANIQGETKIGPCHQWTACMRGYFQKAIIPECRLSNGNTATEYNSDSEYDEMTWAPKVNDADLITCLRNARNMAAFAEMYDGVSAEEGCMVASRDDTTINTLRVLFKNDGDARKAIEELMKNPIPVTIDSKWTEEEVKRFQKGLKIYGKDFFKIRKELLSHKDTKELVEFYYLWKKRPNGLYVRPQAQKQKRTAPFKKGSKNAADKATASEDSNVSESEETKKEVLCKQCNAITSESWTIGGKDSIRLCLACDVLFKKYGDSSSVFNLKNEIMERDSKNGFKNGFLSSMSNSICPSPQSVFVYTALKDKKASESNHNTDPVPISQETSFSKKKSNKRLWNDAENTTADSGPSCSGLKRHRVEKEFNKPFMSEEGTPRPNNAPKPFVKSEYNLVSTVAVVPPIKSSFKPERESTRTDFSMTQIIKDEKSPPHPADKIETHSHSIEQQPSMTSDVMPSSTGRPLSQPMDTFNESPVFISCSNSSITKPFHILPSSASRTASHQKYAIASVPPKFGSPSNSHVPGKIYVGDGPLQEGTVYSVNPTTTQTSGSTQVTTGTFYPAPPTTTTGGSNTVTDSRSNSSSTTLKQSSPVKQLHPKKEKLLAAQQLMDTTADIIPTTKVSTETIPTSPPVKSVNPRKDKLLATQPVAELNPIAPVMRQSPISSSHLMQTNPATLYRFPHYPPGIHPHMMIQSMYPHLPDQIRYPTGFLPAPAALQVSSTVVTTMASSAVTSVPTITQMKPADEKMHESKRPTSRPMPPSSRDVEKDDRHRSNETMKQQQAPYHYRTHSNSFSKSKSSESFTKSFPRRMSDEHRKQPMSKAIKTEKVNHPMISESFPSNPYMMTGNSVSPRPTTDARHKTQQSVKIEPSDSQNADQRRNFPFDYYGKDKMFERYPAQKAHSQHIMKHSIKQEANYSGGEMGKHPSDSHMLYPSSGQTKSARTSPHGYSEKRSQHGMTPPSNMNRSASYNSLHNKSTRHSSPQPVHHHHHDNLPHPQKLHMRSGRPMIIDDVEPMPAPSPPPTSCDVVFTVPTKGQARFIKVWDRRENSCSRTDLVHYPKPPPQIQHSQQHSSSVKTSHPVNPPAASANHPTMKHPHTPNSDAEHRKREQRSIDNMDERRRRESLPGPNISRSTPQRTTPIPPNMSRATHVKTPNTSLYEHKLPVSMVSSSPYMLPDATASRTLQQYASYNDIQRNEALAMMAGARNPLYQYYLPPPERELRERELRELECRDRLSKHGMDVKPHEMLDPRHPHLIPGTPGLHNIPVSAIPTSLADLNALHFEQLRHPFPGMLGGFGPGGPTPGPIPGFPQGAATPGFPVMPIMRPGMELNMGVIDRLTNESLQAERFAAEQRYQMELLHHHHQHSHVHSHLHLHQQPQIPGGPPHPAGTPGGPILPPPNALNLQDQLFNPFTASALEQYAAANPLLAAAIRNPSAAALMHHQHAAMGLHGIVGREQTPHPLSASQQLQAVHEQHLLEHTHRARAGFDPMARFALHKP